MSIRTISRISEQHHCLNKDRRHPAHLAYRIIHRNGQVRWLEHVCQQAFAPNGQSLGWRISNRDITERQVALEQLKASEQRYHSLFENNHAVMLLIDPETGEIADANPVACEFYGYTHAQITQLHIDQINTLPLQEIKAKMKASVRQQQQVYHFQHRQASGQLRYVLVNSGPIEVEGRHLLYSIIHDETEQVHAEFALRQSRDELDLRVRERTTELHQRIHQLRLLAGELTRVEQRERDRLARILHDHLQQLIVAAKLHVGLITAQTTDQDLINLAHETSHLLEESIQTSRSLSMELMPPVLRTRGIRHCLEWLCGWMQDKHKLTVHLEADNEAESADEEVKLLAFESVRELLFNVVKHAGVLQARVHLAHSEDRMRITVSDHGRGFDPAHINAETQASATSFGLVTLRERILLFNGSLDIEAAPGKGSVFTLTLPLHVESIKENENQFNLASVE